MEGKEAFAQGKVNHLKEDEEFRELSFFSYDLVQMGCPPSVLLFVDPILQNKIYTSQSSIYSKICPYNLCGNREPQPPIFWYCMPNTVQPGICYYN